MGKREMDRINTSTYIRSLYAPGYSSVMMSFYKVNLSFNFRRYIGKNNVGFAQYEKDSLTTSVNYEGAALLYQVIMPIFDETKHWDEIKATVQCNNAALVFEYKPDEDKRMAAYLTIDKNNQQITFKFPTHEYEYKKDGQIFTNIIQSGLVVLAKTIDGYLTAVGGDKHLNKLPDVSGESQDENQQASYPTGNNGGYRQGNYNGPQQRNNNSGYQHRSHTAGNNNGYQQGSNTGYQQRNNNSGHQQGNYSGYQQRNNAGYQGYQQGNNNSYAAH